MEKRRILIVDNNDELRAMLERVLRELGHEVVATGDRNEALARQDLDERVSKLGLIKPERSNLFVALDEAFVNAVRHGNRNDPRKLVRITAELSSKEARFTVEDEGEGFDVQEIPDPRDPSNLFKTSGRGVLLIYNIMDEVEYNERGNRLTMVKRPEDSLESDLIEALTPDKEEGGEGR